MSSPISPYPVIAIDGPSASGKGTVAARVADHLGWAYLDSGALYRLTALAAQQQDVAWDDEVSLALLAQHLPVCFGEGCVLLAGADVTEAIRSEAVGMGASAVAKLPAVRTALLQRQRDFLKAPGLVADGRDMASVVFPYAVLKIFLTASAPVRAERRAKQLGVAVGSAEYTRILQDIEKRDEADRNRSVAPLKPTADAHVLDTSNLDILHSVQKVLDWYQQI
ncbi:(d)CMP kinase [Snodgrassella sp. CFCC 13594]|uniref:(d)CMP kinase n=1 Tax=Snodgrassella sp. CFCC 13594 TaxID=1775559 RepID=UPI00082B126E|nr:(d)CMP kinase [Snodgrassella sp. CFCC 13594]